MAHRRRYPQRHGRWLLSRLSRYAARSSVSPALFAGPPDGSALAVLPIAARLGGTAERSLNRCKMKAMPIIRGEKISKCFRIYRHPSDHLKELLTFGKRK